MKTFAGQSSEDVKAFLSENEHDLSHLLKRQQALHRSSESGAIGVIKVQLADTKNIDTDSLITVSVEDTSLWTSQTHVPLALLPERTVFLDIINTDTSLVFRCHENTEVDETLEATLSLTHADVLAIFVGERMDVLATVTFTGRVQELPEDGSEPPAQQLQVRIEFTQMDAEIGAVEHGIERCMSLAREAAHALDRMRTDAESDDAVEDAVVDAFVDALEPAEAARADEKASPVRQDVEEVSETMAAGGPPVEEAGDEEEEVFEDEEEEGVVRPKGRGARGSRAGRSAPASKKGRGKGKAAREERAPSSSQMGMMTPHTPARAVDLDELDEPAPPKPAGPTLMERMGQMVGMAGFLSGVISFIVAVPVLHMYGDQMTA